MTVSNASWELICLSACGYGIVVLKTFSWPFYSFLVFIPYMDGVLCQHGPTIILNYIGNKLPSPLVPYKRGLHHCPLFCLCKQWSCQREIFGVSYVSSKRTALSLSMGDYNCILGVHEKVVATTSIPSHVLVSDVLVIPTRIDATWFHYGSVHLEQSRHSILKIRLDRALASPFLKVNIKTKYANTGKDKIRNNQKYPE